MYLFHHNKVEYSVDEVLNVVVDTTTAAKTKQRMNVIVGVYFSRIFYTTHCLFAVKTTLCLLKPGTRYSRLDPFRGFSIWYFWNPGQETKINEDQLFSTT